MRSFPESMAKLVKSKEALLVDLLVEALLHHHSSIKVHQCQPVCKWADGAVIGEESLDSTGNFVGISLATLSLPTLLLLTAVHLSPPLCLAGRLQYRAPMESSFTGGLSGLY